MTWRAPRWKLARANCEVGAPICYLARAKFVSRVTTSHACKAPRGHTFSLQKQMVRRALSTRTRSNISASWELRGGVKWAMAIQAMRPAPGSRTNAAPSAANEYTTVPAV